LSATEKRHSLLLAMAADAKRQREQTERIEKLRLQKQQLEGRKIVQETAAAEIGVSARQYRTWEGPGAAIRFENLQRLAKYYETTTGFIEYGQEDNRPTPDLVGALEDSDVERQLGEIREELRQINAALVMLSASVLVVATRRDIARVRRQLGGDSRSEAA
jgi:hypothetical protein